MARDVPINNYVINLLGIWAGDIGIGYSSKNIYSLMSYAWPEQN